MASEQVALCAWVGGWVSGCLGFGGWLLADWQLVGWVGRVEYSQSVSRRLRWVGGCQVGARVMDRRASGPPAYARTHGDRYPARMLEPWR